MTTDSLRKGWCKDNNKPSILVRPELVGHKADCWSVNAEYIAFLERMIMEAFNNENN